MKKWMGLLFLGLLFLKGALAEQTMLSIAQLKDTTPAYFEGECRVDKEYAITFRAPVFVPQVESTPVLRIRYQTIDAEAAKDFAQIENEIGFQNLRDFSGCDWPDEGRYTRKGIASVYNLWESEPIVDSHQVYAQNQTFSLGDVVDGLKAFTDAYYHAEFIPQWGYATTAHYQMDKKHQMTDELFDCGALTGLGGYSVWGWVAVEGIPVLGGIGSAQVNQTGHRSCDLRLALRGGDGRIRLEDVFLSDYWIMNCHDIARTSGTVLEDIPLCSFDVIRDELLRMIEQDELRYVYALELGYMMVADPETEYAQTYEEIRRQEFLLVPVWMAEVSQKKSRTGRTLEDFTGPDSGWVDGEYREGGRYFYIQQDPGYEKLYFNAQTGEMLNCKLWDHNDTKLLYPKEILTWNDVHEVPALGSMLRR